MKYLYQQLQQFQGDFRSAFEDENERKFYEMTENFYFEDMLEVCQEIVDLKEVLIDFGYEL